MKARYPESALQRACTEWMVANLRFDEVHEDATAAGSRFDSVGLLDGRLLVIEYKVSMGVTMVDHSPTRSMSIESKIAGGLRSIYSRESGNLAVASNAVWDRIDSPVFALIASTYSSDALQALSVMLSKRSAEWLFGYVVWRWSGKSLEVLLESDLTTSPHVGAYEEIVVPALVGRTPRAPNRSKKELLELAAKRGVAQLVQVFLRSAKEAGLTVRASSRTTISAGRSSAGKWQPYAAVYVDQSDRENGVNIGLDLSATGLSEDALPGAIAPAAGYLNTNRFVNNEADVSSLVEIFSGDLQLTTSKLELSHGDKSQT